MRVKKYVLLFLIVFFANTSYSQYIAVDATYTASQLVQNVLINSGCATVSNISIIGNGDNTTESYGFFSKNGSILPFNSGVLLTTGTAIAAIGPNTSILSQGSTNWLGDADLEQALQISTSINATILEFDFVSLSNQFSFDYIFASEQYLSNPTQNQCNFTDGFAFLLKKANTTDAYTNLAVVPNTTIPVFVNTIRGSGTICPAANETYFDAFNTTQYATNYNGQTVVLTAQSNVVAGETYHIKIVIADQGNRLYDSALFLGAGSFNSTTNIGSDRLISLGNALCENETLVLTTNESGTNTYKWFKNNVEQIGETNADFLVNSPGDYRVEIALNGSTCIISGKVKIEYVALPTIVSPVKLIQCDPNNDGITNFNLTNLNNLITNNNPNTGSVTYYLSQNDAQANTNPIANPSQFLNTNTNQVIAKVTNSNGCANYAVVDLEIAANNQTPIGEIVVCDTDAIPDGFTNFNLNTLVTPQILNGLPNGLVVAYFLNENDAILNQNAIATNFTNTIAPAQTIFARIINGSDCYGIVPISLRSSNFNPIIFLDEVINICPDATAVLSIDTIFSNYLWSNGATTSTISVSQEGLYSVEVTTADGCKATKNFILSFSDIPKIATLEIKDFSGSQNSITIHTTVAGNYFYSIDGVNYQTSATFFTIPPGNYTAYVTDNLCKTDFEAFTILDYLPFFTPNGDGANDYWFIKNLKPSENVRIYDRFGKVLFSFSGNNKGWNGWYNGNQMIADDYWFVLTLQNFRIVRGHFSLIR